MDSHFEVTESNTFGRKGKLRTKNGVLETPFFMPDATRASVRGVEWNALRSSGIEALVVNTYHLMLAPGSALIRNAGGIHAFMNWNGPVLSDSGGYQVYSLIHKHPDRGEVSEDGVVFRSPLNGSRHVLTPEKAIDIQFDLGVDMMVCLDDPRPNDAPPEELRAAVDRTLRWAKRCKQHYELRMSERTSSGRPLLFGVVQGGLDVNLRRECADGLATIGFDGYGFGARHVDMEGNFLEAILRATASFIPQNAPRFALGIGSPSDIVRCARLGWDMFDCVIPTREGRHGRVFIRHRNRSLLDENFSETFSITNERFKEDFGVIDPECLCATCANGFSRGYIRHLFSVGEPLGPQLLSLHNLSFYADLMKELRGHISPSGGSL